MLASMLQDTIGSSGLFEYQTLLGLVQLPVADS